MDIIQNNLHMNVGEAEHSYAKNSTLQMTVILKSKPFLEEAIRDIFARNLPTMCFKIADLGCSSGPNTLFVISNIIGIVRQICKEKELTEIPEFQVFLNDLPGNDFNSLFKLIPSFKSLGMSCYISGVPASFHGRLFPRKSLHFVHSSYSVHWLSEAPPSLVNKGNIYIAETSLPTVSEAYLKQFQKDFSLFLSLRSRELVSGGRMVISLIGRREVNPTSKFHCHAWGMLLKSLHELVDEGIVKEEDIDSFNIPLYKPHEGEVREIIDMERSFIIDKLETVRIKHSDPTDENFGLDADKIGKYLAKHRRAFTEPLLASHFGDHIIDSLFSKFAKHMNKKFMLEHTSIIISLRNK